ncbi:hypothetical protein ACFSFY_00280 [Sporosarcina siberiensis]|uniref:Cyclic lactone autoinducer peptide n=1 Tax=Sporosarcina siberiensis TaxID=1365606 RepID=A0ABW4SC75_9BACL
MKKTVIPYFLSLMLMASLIIHTTSENDDENPKPTEFPSAFII